LLIVHTLAAMPIFADSSTPMAPIDLAIVIAYVVGTTVLGAWFSRRQKSVTTYFVGDRNVSWWLVLISIVATETSTVTFLSIPGVAFGPLDAAKGTGSFTFLQLAMGYIVGRIIVAFVLLPQYMRGELFSAYQVLKIRFDSTVQRTASGVFLITRTIVDGLRLCLTALLLQQFTGWDIRISILVLGAITILYTYLGGMEAVIWTDLVQFAVYVAGAIFAFVMIVRMLPDGWNQLFQMTSSAGRLQLFDFDPSLIKVRTFWAGLIGGTFVSMASHGADQNMVQRYLCARSLGQAQTALISSGFLILAQFTLFLFIGQGLWAISEIGSFSVPEGTGGDAVFGRFIVGNLPVGVIGLVTAAVLASAMASFSSSLNSASNAIVTDFYRPLRPDRSEAFYLRLSKWMTALVGVSKVGIALVCIPMLEKRLIVDQVLALAAVTTGLVLGLFLLGSLPRVVSSQSALVGMLVGFIVTGTFWIAWINGRTILAWPWFAPIGTLTTAGVALILDRFGPANGPSHH
jgi:SSS family transporter